MLGCETQHHYLYLQIMVADKASLPVSIDYGCGKTEQTQGYRCRSVAHHTCLRRCSTGMHMLVIAQMVKNCPYLQGYTRFEAKIGEDNQASLKLFADAGFVRKRHVAAFKEVTMAFEADAQLQESLRGLLIEHVQQATYDT